MEDGPENNDQARGVSATDLDAEVSTQLPGHAQWEQILAWISGCGAGKIYHFLNERSNDADYRKWLMEQVQDNGDEFDLMATPSIKLSQLPASCSIDVGVRIVSLKSLKIMLRKLIMQGMWRAYDRVKLCSLEPDGKALFFIKFHHRAAAMHLLMRYYYETNEKVPTFCGAMASRIDLDYLGSMGKEEAVARGLSLTTAMDEGIKQSWLDIVLQARASNDETFGSKLHSKVLAISPEHADKMAEWKSLGMLCTRVDAIVYELIKNFMEEHNMEGPPIPQKWMSPNFLLPAKRQSKAARTDSLDVAEHILVFKRLLHLTKSRAEKEGIPFDDPHFATAVARRVSITERTALLGVTKKYIQGIEAAANASGASYDELETHFIAGEYDTVIQNTSQPSTTGKYWSFVKEYDAMRLSQSREEAVQKAEQLAREAAAEVEEFSSRMHDEEKQKEEDTALEEYIVKVRQSYLLQLKSWHAKNKSVAEKVISETEELWYLRQDDIAKQQQEAMTGELFLTKQSILADSSQFLNLLHGAPPPLFLFDYALATFEASLLTKAMLLIGKRGVVLLLFSAEAADSEAMILQEQEVLHHINLEGMHMRRVFLKWKESNLLGSCYVLMPKTQEHSESRLCSSHK